MWRVHDRVAQHRSAVVRALRSADGVAGAALRGVRGAATGIRLRSRGRGVRRAGAPDRRRLEGAWSQTACRVGGARGRRDGRAAGDDMSRLRAVRSGPPLAARPPSGGAAGTRARRSLGFQRRAHARPGPRISSPARADTLGTATERRYGLPAGRPASSLGDAHRRRLHHRRDGQRGRVCAAEGGSPKGRNSDVRPDDSHSLGSDLPAREETRCDFR